MRQAALSGLESVLAEKGRLFAGRRIALLTNPTAVDASMRHAAELLSERAALLRLFGPEHGVRGDAQDMIAVAGARDPATGLEVVSLYGSDEVSLSPPPGSLEGIDALVYDIQDIGSRYYTYVWTLVLAMRACARAGVEVIVLDRPNPLGGTVVEGGPIAPGFESFVGLRSLPNRHGLTAGELARWACEHEKLDLELTVVPCRGWERAALHPDTGRTWVMPSPNMPSFETALVYPGMCLVEGTELSEGRGTTRPFELVGAPFIDGAALAEALAAEALPGVVWRPVVFRPMFHKHAGLACGGVQPHIRDPHVYQPYRCGVAFLRAVRALWPEHFAWRTHAYEFVADIPAIDLLAGSAELRTGIEAGATLGELAAGWAAYEAEWADAREPYLLYR